ncbi:hypothetical protein [Azotosporobacter soli]|uniref:hypothetical protein n=1 Tax=Azotosporobacter soli TaxID=3055040 RepID=UPI0031FF3471
MLISSNIINQELLEFQEKWEARRVETIISLLRLTLANKVGALDGVMLDRLMVQGHFRNKGLGTEALVELLAISNKYNFITFVYPSDGIGGDQKRIEKFYTSHGFLYNKGETLLFANYPGMYYLPTLLLKMMQGN